MKTLRLTVPRCSCVHVTVRDECLLLPNNGCFSFIFTISRFKSFWFLDIMSQYYTGCNCTRQTLGMSSAYQNKKKVHINTRYTTYFTIPFPNLIGVCNHHQQSSGPIFRIVRFTSTHGLLLTWTIICCVF
jgi:hypothetical protein